MDKTWMHKPRNTREYSEGVTRFIEFAFQNSCHDGKIYCPCKDCGNQVLMTRAEVEHHLMFRGISIGYANRWCYHKEPKTSSVKTNVNQAHQVDMASDMHHLLRDAFGIHNIDNIDEQEPNEHINEHSLNDEEMLENNTSSSGPNEESSEFDKFFQEADEKLYSGCSNFSVLSFVVRLLHIKFYNKWSDQSMEMLLSFLKEVFPNAKIPSSFNEAKKVINVLGLSYNKIDVCPNNCILYWGERANQERCDKCDTSRWKSNEAQQVSHVPQKKKKIPVKVMRYFPLIPRLQRLYMSSLTSTSMRWHNEGRNKDGKLRHPADSLAWRSFDERYPDFASDSRNVRLGLASDGFNPFGIMSNAYSIWPIILVPYNLPPWMCTRQESFILSMIIPGEKGPGDQIDVFLQPLIAELLELWEGVDTYDATSKKVFKMRATLMWTINDFPAYAYLSGWSTKGKYACPVCADKTDSRWLNKGGKFCYLAHRRWLSPSHNFRKRKCLFDGKEELRLPPMPLSGTDSLRQLEGVDFIVDNLGNQNNKDIIWKKKSIFFKLPYWEYQMLRHNLDVMHIEKNVCENVIGTLLNVGNKKKENEKAREDLVLMDIRHELHPQVAPNGRKRMPPACYHMSREEKDIFFRVLKDLKVPDSYSSNISRGVNMKERKLQCLKTHDYHILMQDILPIALRSCMTEKVTKVIVELSFIFKVVCSKTLNVEELEQLESRAALTMCHMEMIFPPSFFRIMTHLVIHIIAEAKIAGPVHYRWMYPIERCLKVFKGYVGNKAQPEGSIAERYIASECLNFCSRYLEGIETKFNRPHRNPDVTELEGDKYLFRSAGKVIGATKFIFLDEKTWTQAHRYVLFQHEEVNKFREEFIRIKRGMLRNKRPTMHALNKLVSEEFPDWFKMHVSTLGEGVVSEATRQLAVGPNRYAKSYTGMTINGVRFHTKDRDVGKKTQNSGVVAKSLTTSYSSVRDQNPIEGNVDFFGELTNIIELDYFGRFKVVLFQCNWADITRGIKKDPFGFTLVNFSRLSHTGKHISDDPFILSSQAQPTLYVQDPTCPEWSVVLKITTRDVFDVGEDLFEGLPDNGSQTNHEFEDPEWVRTDIHEDIYADNL